VPLDRWGSGADAAHQLIADRHPRGFTASEELHRLVRQTVVDRCETPRDGAGQGLRYEAENGNR
jgi:hypothetical protein